MCKYVQFHVQYRCGCIYLYSHLIVKFVQISRLGVVCTKSHLSVRWPWNYDDLHKILLLYWRKCCIYAKYVNTISVKNFNAPIIFNGNNYTLHLMYYSLIPCLLCWGREAFHILFRPPGALSATTNQAQKAVCLVRIFNLTYLHTATHQMLDDGKAWQWSQPSYTIA